MRPLIKVRVLNALGSFRWIFDRADQSAKKTPHNTLSAKGLVALLARGEGESAHAEGF